MATSTLKTLTIKLACRRHSSRALCFLLHKQQTQLEEAGEGCARNRAVRSDRLTPLNEEEWSRDADLPEDECAKWQQIWRSPLWRGRGGSKEALLVVRYLRRAKGDSWRLHEIVRAKVSRLLKLDLLAALNELQRLDEVDLALMVFIVVRRESWYKPEVYLYRDMLNCLGRNKRTAQARILLDDSKREGIKPSTSLCSELMVAYLKQGMVCEAIEIFEGVKAAIACDRLIYNILLKELHQIGRFDLWFKYKKEYKITFYGEELDSDVFCKLYQNLL